MPALTDDQLAAWKQLQWATALITSQFRRDLAAAGLSRSGITRLLDRMERDGLITRTVSTTDRRRFDVSLTTPGCLRFDQAWPAHADGIGRYFAQPLTPRDIGELARILDSLIQANQNHDQPG